MDLMNFLMQNWSLALVAVVSGTMLLWPAVRGSAGGGVAPGAAVQMINREKGVVVDVSESEEFASGHINGAKNIPLNQLDQRLPELVKNKGVPLILVDPSGARAQRAVGMAKSLGYDKAVALAGGLKAWKEANLPLEKA